MKYELIREGSDKIQIFNSKDDLILQICLEAGYNVKRLK